MTISVVVYKDRTRPGAVAWGDEPEANCDCYAKADNAGAARHGNADRSPLLPYGDTPTGVYRCHAVSQRAIDQSTIRKYGPNGYIALDPISGDALTAKHNGRFGLLIHGGDLNKLGKLRPTFGCIRLRDEDMVRLQAAIGKLSAEERKALTCDVWEV